MIYVRRERARLFNRGGCPSRCVIPSVRRELTWCPKKWYGHREVCGACVAKGRIVQDPDRKEESETDDVSKKKRILGEDAVRRWANNRETRPNSVAGPSISALNNLHRRQLRRLHRY